MSRKQRLQILPSLLTAFGLMCGLFVIFKANMTGVGEMELATLKATAGLLLLAGLFDILDGMLARAIDAVTEFGGVFDSIADAVSFGVAPVVIVLKSLSLEAGTAYSFLITTSALVFSVSGVLRLVRFSISSELPKQEKLLPMREKKHFIGLPIPAAAAAIVSLNLLSLSPEFLELFPLGRHARVLMISSALTLLGYLMVSRWRFPSIKRLQVRVYNFQILFLIIVAAALLFYGFLNHFILFFFLISWAYLLAAWIVSLIRFLSGRDALSKDEF